MGSLFLVGPSSTEPERDICSFQLCCTLIYSTVPSSTRADTVVANATTKKVNEQKHFQNVMLVGIWQAKSAKTTVTRYKNIAGVVSEQFTYSGFLCPCHNKSVSVPSFVGNDCFCDSAVRDGRFTSSVFFPDDPLWDGQGCGSTSTCCEFNSPPWFCKQLPQPTTDDIELRICNGNPPGSDDTPFESIEIYIN